MKTVNTIFKLFIVSIVLMACSTEDPADLDSSLHIPDVVTPPVSAGTFTGKIDGVDYTIDIATAVSADGKITITGKRGDEVITLRMPSDIIQNSVTNPYTLEGAGTDYSAFYNTDVSTVSEATILSDLHMTVDGSPTLWIADAPSVTIVGGVTTIKGLKSTTVDSGLLEDGEPLFIPVDQTVNMTVQGDQSGSYSFGVTNFANYNAGGAGGDVFEADMTADNGNVTFEIDELNKLISGTFNFDGTERYTETGDPLTGADTDGDGMLDGAGVVDGTELNLGYDPKDPCSPIMPEGYTGYDPTNTIWLGTHPMYTDPTHIDYIDGVKPDCNLNGISNEDEIIAGTDPYEGNTDTDGDGVSDAQGVIDGTDENDPCDPVQNQFYTNYTGTNTIWMAADCDGDTINNGDELAGPDGDILTTVDNTNPYFLDFLDKTFTAGSFSKVPYAQPDVLRGLNISTHNTTDKRIVGTYSFISKSLGPDTRWYVVTEGTFDVTYE